jgi:tryptophanyl-tRNA synthetase
MLEIFMENNCEKKLVSGMRPTGKLHIGHWQGALTNWVNLQNNSEYDCMFFVADWHALTTKYSDTKNLISDSLEMVADWLAIGIDPKKSILFQQSMVKTHAELFLILSMITPISWLERCPTYKDMIKEFSHSNQDISNLGFLGYPVLMTADIILYNASVVPVGEDQLPHLELTREILRRFNFIYNKEVFIEPKALLTKTPRLLGTDGRKMSKSYNNSIFLSDTDSEIETKIKSMITDPQRIKATDLGNPDICSIFYLQKIFNTNEEKQIECDCKNGKIGCVSCKKKLISILKETLSPIREKRETVLKDKDFLMDIIKTGSNKANEIANKNMEKIRKAINLF